MRSSTKRWMVGYAVFLLLGAIAYGVLLVARAEAYTVPIVLVFVLGYLAGRISMIIERGGGRHATSGNRGTTRPD